MLTEKDDANAIAGRDRLLGYIAEQVVTSKTNEDYVPCLLGLGLLVKQTLRLATEFDGRMTMDEEIDAYEKLEKDGRISVEESSLLHSMSVTMYFLNGEDLNAPMLVPGNSETSLPPNDEGIDKVTNEPIIINFGEQETWTELASDYTAGILPICRKLICD